VKLVYAKSKNGLAVIKRGSESPRTSNGRHGKRPSRPAKHPIETAGIPSPALLSEKNPLLKKVRRAAAHGSLTEDGCAVAESVHLLEEALESDCEIRAVIVAESSQRVLAPYASRLKRTRVAVAPDAVFAKLSTTQTPQGVLALVRPPVWSFDQLLRGLPLVVVLDGIQDPGNAGGILRAAEAFGATGAVFLRGTVSPYNPKCLRASAGSLFRLPLLPSIDGEWLIDALTENRIELYSATSHAGRLVADTNLAGPCAIVIGSEGCGVSRTVESRATALRIPTSKVESLNAAVAAGVLLYEAARQRAGLRA